MLCDLTDGEEGLSDEEDEVCIYIILPVLPAFEDRYY